MLKVIRENIYSFSDLLPWFAAEPAMLVPERARKCVLFVGIKDADDKFRPRATAFVVRIQEEQHLWHYVVTAEHVISGLLTKGHTVWLRFNNKAGSPSEVKTSPKDWMYHPNLDKKTDVAIVPISFDDDCDIDPVPIVGPRSVAATRETIQNINIDIGEEVVITGLFRSHHGLKRNIPITRIGNIAMLDAEPVKTKYCGYIDAYLVEARSIGGLSGSPAFVHLASVRTMGGKPITVPYFQLYLLGLVHGHFDIEDLNHDVVLDDETDATSGIHTGIGVVVPVEKIIETVMQEELIDVRKKIVKEDRKKGGATSDLADDDDLPSSDENPKHREDFSSLVNAPQPVPVQAEPKPFLWTHLHRPAKAPIVPFYLWRSLMWLADWSLGKAIPLGKRLDP